MSNILSNVRGPSNTFLKIVNYSDKKKMVCRYRKSLCQMVSNKAFATMNFVGEPSLVHPLIHKKC